MRFSASFRSWYRDDVILSIGSTAITRERLVRDYQCSNFRAAALLAAALDALKVRSIGGLMRVTPDDLLRLEGVGERTIFVATCLIDRAGGDVLAWLNADDHRHRTPEPLAGPPPPPPRRARARLELVS